MQGRKPLSIRCCVFLLSWISCFCFAQTFPHKQAHAHNDYEHPQPLFNALQNGFISVEADVYLVGDELLVSHNRPKPGARTLQKLYLTPLDSLLSRHDGRIYPNQEGTFYLMVDCKTEAESTYEAIQKALTLYPNLACTTSRHPVTIFLSGNRPVSTIINKGYQGISLDGRPNDLGKGISSALMPVVSDNFSNWSAWNGKSAPQADDLKRIRDLAQRVHAEGKKLRLWAIPDNELTWAGLLDAGVDFINTDRLEALHEFLVKKGL